MFRNRRELHRDLFVLLVVILVGLFLFLRVEHADGRGRGPLAKYCSELPQTRAYIAALFVPDASGRPDLDYANDRLQDVPSPCNSYAYFFGKALHDVVENGTEANFDID